MEVRQRKGDTSFIYGLEYKEVFYKDDEGEKVVPFVDYGAFVHVAKIDFESLLLDLARVLNNFSDSKNLRERVKVLQEENKLYKEKYGQLALGLNDEVLLAGRPGKLTSEHRKFIRLHLYDMTSRRVYENLRDFYGYEGKEQTVANFRSRLRKIEKEIEVERSDKKLGIDYSELDFDLFSQEPFSDFDDEIKKAIRKMYAFDKVRDKSEVGRAIAKKYGVSDTEVEVYIEMFEKGAGWL